MKQTGKRIRLLAAALCCALLLGCTACRREETVYTNPWSDFSVQPMSREMQAEQRHAAVLYDGGAGSGSWQDVYSRLQQAVVLGFDAVAVDVSQGMDLSGFDAVYPDGSILNRPQLAEAIADFVRDGGNAFLTNAFYDYFPLDFLGANSFVKVEGCPVEGLSYPEVGEDLRPLQEIVADFAALYPKYGAYEALSGRDYGYGMIPATATVLVSAGDTALYTMNQYGAGYVFFTNPLLPNAYSVNGFAVESRNEEQEAFSATTATCNQLLENEFMAFLARKEDGYSLSRVYGSYGRPNMAWELHYEEMTGFAHEASTLFGERAREYLQVPSYSVVRSTYWWFLRAEAVTYLLGSAEAPFTYQMDLHESAYSSGTHVAAGGEWLSLQQVKDPQSYFIRESPYDQRAYPYVADLDGDGELDILSGSADGKLYFFKGTGFTDRLTTEASVPVTDGSGQPLAVASHSAPVLADVDGDGILDIVCGTGAGTVVWFAGNGDGTYEQRGTLCSAWTEGQALPDVGDLNGDGCPDLVVGSSSGQLAVWYGQAADSLRLSAPTAIPIPEEAAEKFLSPRIVDFDGDGAMDLAVGTGLGYVMRLRNRNGEFVFDGYLTGDEMNYHGNHNVMFQNNCVPFFVDLNGDGVLDLVAGALEYGLAYPVDSEYFPESAREGLAASLQYMKDNHFYCGAHVLTNAYASAGREDYELAAQRAALEAYGLDWSAGLGANHHTWFTSTLSHNQSLAAEWRAGLLWDSGYSPARSVNTAPQVAAENAVVYPFFLQLDGEDTLLVQNCSTILYRDDSYGVLSGKYEMPVCLFYHMDFCYEEQNQEGTEKNLQLAEQFRRNYAYNFVGEDQMMAASAAAIHLRVDAQGEENGFTLTPYTDGETYPLENGHYQAACGVKITFGEALSGRTFTTDASVWHRGENGALYVAVDRPVRVYEEAGEETSSRLRQVNLPAEIAFGESGNGVSLTFHDDGMMQVLVEGDATTADKEWTVTRRDGNTLFTRYGEAAALTITYKG